MSLTWLNYLGIAMQAAAILTMPFVLIERRARPLAAVSWILALVSLPTMTTLYWWLIGRQYLERKRRSRKAALKVTTHKRSQLKTGLSTPTPEAAEALLPIKRVPNTDDYGFFPASSRNSAEVLVDGPEFFKALETAIRAAKHHVHFQFYILRSDVTGNRFRDLFIEKARQGVEVRVLYDGLGSISLSKRYLNALEDAGVKTAAFLPLRLSFQNIGINFRNHRKIVVVDGGEAFIGSGNVGDEYATTWHDIGLKITGPAVDQLQEVFADDWFFASREDLFRREYFARWTPADSVENVSCGLIASGPDSTPDINVTHDAFFVAINSAKERILMTTPYFIPDEAILTALRTAVYRGVDVKILLPKISDLPLVRLAAWSYYPDLLGAGVKIFEYEPRVLHAKALVIDRELAILGSANIDTRSFRLNFEASCFVAGSKINERLAQIFVDDLAQSHPITIEKVRSQSFFDKVIGAAAHLLSPLI